MAVNWTHDRPLPAAPPKGRKRRVEPQRARLELPMPMPMPHAPVDEAAQPAQTPERGFAEIDFYV